MAADAESKGTARATFVIGALLTLPGASYLLGLHQLNRSTTHLGTVLVVIGFNLVMLLLLEAPLMAFAIAPEAAPKAVDRCKAWAGTAREDRCRLGAVRGGSKPGAQGGHRPCVTAWEQPDACPRVLASAPP